VATAADVALPRDSHVIRPAVLPDGFDHATPPPLARVLVLHLHIFTEAEEPERSGMGVVSMASGFLHLPTRLGGLPLRHRVEFHQCSGKQTAQLAAHE